MKITILLFLKIFSFSILSFSQSWNQIGSDIFGESSEDWSGYSVDINSDGTIIVVGASRDDGNGNNSGSVKIFEWNGTDWVQKGQSVYGKSSGDYFGHNVSISSDGIRMVAGSLYNNDANMDSGQIRVFEWNGSSWVQLGGNINGVETYEVFGKRVSISKDGSTIAAGGNSLKGLVRIYTWNGTAWLQKGATLEGDFDEDAFGSSVSLSSDGNILVVGSPLNDESFYLAGSVKVFEWDGSLWIQKGQNITGESDTDYFGISVDITDDGNTIVSGGELNSGTGHTRIYYWDGAQWAQKGQDIDGEEQYDYSGKSVSISSSGNIVAIGSPNWINYTDGGETRIYEWKTNQWVKIGNDINGDNLEDKSGYSVSLSSDGSKVIIGAYDNDSNGYSSGLTRVYECPTCQTLTTEKVKIKNQIIYPNPNNGIFTLEFGKQINGNISITNVLDKEVYAEKIKADKLKISLGLPKGVYFANIKTEQGNSVVKFVVE